MEFVKLGDICSIKTGKLDANASSLDGKYPFFTCSREPLKINSYSYDCECVLVAGNGDLNVKYYIGKFDAYQRTYIIKVNNKDLFRTKYIYLLIESKLEELRNKSIGGVIKYIKLGDLTNIKVPNISNADQEKIINKFFRLQETISIKQNQIIKLDELIKSQFVEMFGDININSNNYEESKLNNHLKVIGGYAFKSKDFKENGIPILRIGNINAGYFKPKDLMFWNECSNLENYVIYPGDVVISLTGTVGKDDYGNICIMSDEYDKYYLNQRNAKLILKETINSIYIVYALRIPEIKKRLTGISRGVRQANIANKDIENLKIPIPPIDLQNRFAKMVEQIDKQKFVIENSLKKLEELQSSLMQEYFG